MNLFSSKKLHYLIPISLAIGAFQVVIAVVTLYVNWMQFQEIKTERSEMNRPVIQAEAEK